MIRIGNLELENIVALGPMAGVSDLPFRHLCREMGCSLLVTEMVSAKAMHYHNKNTEELLRTEEGEHPQAVQLFGSEPEILAEAAKRLEEGPCDIIDFNMGCPVPKVAGNREGSALMKEPMLAAEIFTAMVKAVQKPVTVKMRSGWDDEHINAPEIAHIAEECGISAVTVHARTRQQYYSGKADWSIIRRVKDTVRIPVIGNGDVTGPESALSIREETGCDGIMVARAARGNPWIFREIQAALKGEAIPARPSREEICEMMLRHARMQAGQFGERMGVMQMRKQFAWYTTGMKGASAVRREVNQANTLDDLEKLLTKLRESDKIL